MDLATFQKKRIPISCIIQTAEVMIEADKNMVDPVLRNRINDAIKLSRRNGEIKLMSHYEKGIVKIYV